MARQYMVGTIYEYLTCVPADVISCAPLDNPIQNRCPDLQRQREHKRGQPAHSERQMRAINAAQLAEVVECGNEEADTADDGGLEIDVENPPLYSQDVDVEYTAAKGIDSQYSTFVSPTSAVYTPTEHESYYQPVQPVTTDVEANPTYNFHSAENPILDIICMPLLVKLVMRLRCVYTLEVTNYNERALSQMLKDCISWAKMNKVNQIILETNERIRVRCGAAGVRIVEVGCSREVNCAIRCLINCCKGRSVVFLKVKGIPKLFSKCLHWRGCLTFLLGQGVIMLNRFLHCLAIAGWAVWDSDWCWMSDWGGGSMGVAWDSWERGEGVWEGTRVWDPGGCSVVY
nr:uncharacterized protein LOC109147873 [Ipomoea batatas]